MSAQGLDTLSTWRSGITSHVGLTVPDLDEGRRFYCGLLGFVEMATYESAGPLLDRLTGIPGVVVKTAMLAVPGAMRIQMQTFEPAGANGPLRHSDRGLTHLSWGVRDVQVEYERLTAAGVRFRGEPTAMRFADEQHLMNDWTVAYFDDPWGLPLELLGPTPGRSPDNQERA